jgi:hypothetical protein
MMRFAGTKEGVIIRDNFGDPPAARRKTMTKLLI